jgi:hypothetical protein
MRFYSRDVLLVYLQIINWPYQQECDLTLKLPHLLNPTSFYQKLSHLNFLNQFF